MRPQTATDAPVYTVALTGGIASGKTLVSDTFAGLGVTVIDTDVIAHQVVEPGCLALSEISNAFGEAIIDEQGRLQRRKLRTLIFSDPSAQKKLESILHPKIRAEVKQAIAAVGTDYCLLVIPLLAEHGAFPDIDRVLVVDIEPETQISRLMIRDGCDRDEAKQALASQASREQRLKMADDVLLNNGTAEDTRHKVRQLHQKYLQLSQPTRD